MPKKEKKEKRPYPKRMTMEEIQFKAIVLLRDSGKEPFTRIAKVLGFKNSSVRNIEYYYNLHKGKEDFKCQCSNCVVPIKVASGMSISETKIIK